MDFKYKEAMDLSLCISNKLTYAVHCPRKLNGGIVTSLHETPQSL